MLFLRLIGVPCRFLLVMGQKWYQQKAENCYSCNSRFWTTPRRLWFWIKARFALRISTTGPTVCLFLGITFILIFLKLFDEFLSHLLVSRSVNFITYIFEFHFKQSLRYLLLIFKQRIFLFFVVSWQLFSQQFISHDNALWYLLVLSSRLFIEYIIRMILFYLIYVGSV